MITIQQEKFKGMYQEAMPLIEKHWAEVTDFKDGKVNPDIDLYLKAEECGVLKIVTARDGEELIGYLSTFVRGYLHSKNNKQSFVDAIYVKDEYRNRDIGRRLIKAAGELAKNEGAVSNTVNAKLAHPALGNLLEGLGYEAVEVVYIRRL